MIFIFLGLDSLKVIFHHPVNWDPLHGAAYAFWAAFSILSLLGVFYPLKMMPLLLLQFLYKSIWLLSVAYPLWTAGGLKGSPAEGMAMLFLRSIIVDLLVIPWPYVLKNFILKARQT